MADQIKDMLQEILGRLDEQGTILKAVRGRLDEQGAEIQGINERLDRQAGELKAIRKDMATKEDVAEIREDIHTLIELYGEQQHEVRKLKRKVREAQ